MTFWPLLSTAKGLSGSTLYDMPSSVYTSTGVIVNATTISAKCGLLSNLSVGTWNCTLPCDTPGYCVDVDGLGEVDLTVLGMCHVQVSVQSAKYIY